MPHSAAACRTAGSARPSGRGGVQRITSGQRASCAGTPSISAVDGRGAEPAGTYRPTRWIGRGRLPNSRLQEWLHQGRYGNDLTKFAAWTHWFWFIQPYASIFWIAIRNKEKFPESARQLAATFDIGCAMYFALPTAPPWWAAENGYIDPKIADEHINRVMLEYGEKLWGPAWTRIFGTLGSNPWAAMPSLHFATAVMAAILLSDAGGKVEGTLTLADDLAAELVVTGSFSDGFLSYDGRRSGSGMR